MSLITTAVLGGCGLCGVDWGGKKKEGVRVGERVGEPKPLEGLGAGSLHAVRRYRYRESSGTQQLRADGRWLCWATL